MCLSHTLGDRIAFLAELEGQTINHKMDENKEYYAFISYMREDEKWAKWLQNKLEHYKFPTNLNGRIDLPIHESESWGQELLYTKYSLKPHNGNLSFWQAATNTTWPKARAATCVVRSTRFTEACAIWLATRMGMPTVKDAPGIEMVQTNNLLIHDQIVGMVKKLM